VSILELQFCNSSSRTSISATTWYLPKYWQPTTSRAPSASARFRSPNTPAAVILKRRCAHNAILQQCETIEVVRRNKLVRLCNCLLASLSSVWMTGSQAVPASHAAAVGGRHSWHGDEDIESIGQVRSACLFVRRKQAFFVNTRCGSTS
jgi:hypothetical protein